MDAVSAIQMLSKIRPCKTGETANGSLSCLKIEVVNDFLQKQRPAKSTQHSPLICLDNLEQSG
jgi:hypothetical protein